ncbi:(deoxy)nucleoside triphosphate pyrophosphohydrolase [Qipengyuania sp. MTN3-11]|uniref:(deoxy)nucleoside triphosphate pyrophosphohydrolase n=1 Tax=Qipengyuania sp. MTN3-11 TaxID=3056557 RepID=UPI0036F34E0A
MEKKPTFVPVVAVALQREDGRWLMHRRPAGKAHAGLWEFPGGKVENGEMPRDALVREIVEELGVVLEKTEPEPVGFAEWAGGEASRPIVILLYTSRSWTGEPASLEGGATGWFRPEEIARLERPPLDLALCRQLFEERQSPGAKRVAKPAAPTYVRRSNARP